MDKTADASSVEVPDTSVFVAYPTAGTVSVDLHHALIDLERWDRLQGHNNYKGELVARSGANISKARNELCARFLTDTDGEWLWFVDTDMTFPPETLARLLCAATMSDAKVVGGLCVMLTADGPIPTIYQMGNTQVGEVTRVMLDYPPDMIIQVAATGAACLLIHRSALEAMKAKAPGNPFPWFIEAVVNKNWVSEDLMFCLRSNEAGMPVFVDCTTPVGHVKNGRIWWPDDIKNRVGFPTPRTHVIVPVKDRLDLTASLVDQLREQGGWDELIICDNGSAEDTHTWLAEQPDVTVLDMPGVGIHEMWNAGADLALKDGRRRNVNLVFLNNDLKLGPNLCRGLVDTLRGNDDLVTVCPNYDGRVIDGPVQFVTDICANRYDGTGGLAGFAFAVRGEWFLSGYRFPEQCKWWYGDNDLVMAAQYADGKVGIARDVTVEHLDGGGQSGDWADPEIRPVLEADRLAFEDRWQRIHAERAQVA